MLNPQFAQGVPLRSGDLLDSRIETIIIQANGINFEVDTCGEGDCLALCLHGFPEHSVSWRFQMPMLAELGYTVWAPNLRGYGNSDAPRELEAYSLEVLMQDVSSLIEVSGCNEVVLIAHDWGAVIAWHFAMREPDRLKKLIICNVPHPVPASAALSNGLEQLKKSWYIFFFQLPWFPEWLMTQNKDGMGQMISNSATHPENFSADVIDLYNENASRPKNLTAMLNYYRALVRGGGAARQRRLGYPVISLPTLMVWGEADMALTVETTYGTDAQVSNLTMRYLPGISHWVQQDAPDSVNAMISAFLQDLPVPEYEI